MPSGTGQDGPQDDAPPTDAPQDAPQASGCVAAWRAGTPDFTTPDFVMGTEFVTMADERDPWVSEDQLTIYFIEPNSGDFDVVVATRGAVTESFAASTVVTTLNDGFGNDSGPAMSDDELTMFLASTRTGGDGGADIWVSTRAAGSTTFGPVTQTHLDEVNDVGDQFDPHISPDGLRLYYSSNELGTPLQLVVASRATVTDAFSLPVPIFGTVRGNDLGPTLTDDERVLVFASDRDGGLDLFYATRAERDQPFGPVQPLLFNAASDDADPHITANGCRIYFASQRKDGNDYDLYVTDMVAK